MKGNFETENIVWRAFDPEDKATWPNCTAEINGTEMEGTSDVLLVTVRNKDQSTVVRSGFFLPWIKEWRDIGTCLPFVREVIGWTEMPWGMIGKTYRVLPEQIVWHAFDPEDLNTWPGLLEGERSEICLVTVRSINGGLRTREAVMDAEGRWSWGGDRISGVLSWAQPPEGFDPEAEGSKDTANN